MSQPCSQEAAPLSQQAVQHGTTCDAASELHGEQFECPIHGQFRLNPVCSAVVHTPQFQRLGQLKQLGLAYHAFPSAEHSRLPHSLGTAYLAHEFASKLMYNQPELELSPEDVSCVTLAGLCHDLGHGPFSHTFEHEFLRCRLGRDDWKHEEMSCALLDMMFQELPYSLVPEEDDIGRIKMMIEPKDRLQNYAKHPQRYLYDIVSNSASSIDVDKFDYLVRDSFHCGTKISFDHRTTMRAFKVVGNEVCFHRSHYQELHELFHSRALMHRKVYTHRGVKALNLMLADALAEADEALQISARLDSAEDFMTLDDTLLRRIEYPDLILVRNLGSEAKEKLEKAQRICKAMRSKTLYPFINEVLVPVDDIKSGRWNASMVPTPAEVIQCYRGSNEHLLKPDEIVISHVCIDYAMKGKNPLDGVKFFESWGSKQAFHMPKHQASHLITDCFSEHSLRAYSKNLDPEVAEAVEIAFERWQKKAFGDRGMLATPSRQRKKNPQDTIQEAIDCRALKALVEEGHTTDCTTPPEKKKPRIS